VKAGNLRCQRTTRHCERRRRATTRVAPTRSTLRRGAPGGRLPSPCFFLATVLPLSSNICLLRRRRHTPRMRGIQYAAASRMSTGASEYWIVRSSRTMTVETAAPGQAIADMFLSLATPNARAMPEIFRPIETEGAGNAGCPMHPQPGARWGSQVCAPVFTAEAPESSGIPHAMVFTVSFALSPVTSSFLPPSPHGLNGASNTGWVDRASARLSISNGCQDHTTSPYASAPFVLRASLDRSRV
jgi:hypothetical protein